MSFEAVSVLAPGAGVVIVGGGFTGAVAAMHFALKRPDLQIQIVERDGVVGRGLAYGAATPSDLLNVPVHRLKIGLAPDFEEWLRVSKAEAAPAVAIAVAEAGGSLSDAFLPRCLFGDYVAWQFGTRRKTLAPGAIQVVRGAAVGFLDSPRRGVVLDDGREIEGSAVVLALGNPPPKAPLPSGSPVHDHPGFIRDPWAAGALDGLAREARIVLVGSGLTMVDIALRLSRRGHSGVMTALSRNGRLPSVHALGGSWAPFIEHGKPIPPLELLAIVRAEIRRAEGQGVPWQRVVDALRPSVATIWRSWSHRERQVFLRRLRAVWDVHRHRLAPRVRTELDALIDRGGLVVRRAREITFATQEGRIEVSAVIGNVQRRIDADAVINCTGPRTDYDQMGDPLILDGRRRGLLGADPLRLGIEADECAVVDREGRRSHWLFALGPLTRPAWWEITAAPEIVAQVRQLAAWLEGGSDPASLEDAFLDLGAGI